MTTRKKWGITLILLPGTLFIATLFLQIIVRFVVTSNKVANNTSPVSCQNFESMQGIPHNTGYTSCNENEDTPTQSAATKTINIISILVGTFVILGFFPSVIAGVILLATPGKQPLPPNAAQ